MQNIFRSAFPTPPAPNPNQYWRILALYAGLGGYLITRLTLIPAFDTLTDSIGWDPVLFAAVHVTLIAVSIVVYLQTRQNALKTAASLLTAILLAEAALYLLADSWYSLRGWSELWAAIILGHLLLDQRESRVIVLLSMILIVISSAQNIADLDSDGQRERIAITLLMVAWTLGFAAIARIASSGNQLAIQAILRDVSAQHLIDIGQILTQHVGTREDLDTILQTIADNLEHRFPNIHHIQIYLVEPESDNAVLTAATGTIGQQLINQEHKLGVGGLSPVGRVTLTGNHLLIPDFKHETIHSPNDLLMEMRAEVVVPLKSADRVTGALDLQSRQVDAFSQADITLLSAIANQIAMAVDTLQLYTDTQRKSRENRTLYEQTQLHLREIERLNYQLTGRAWSEYLRLQSDVTTLTLDLTSGDTDASAEWTPTLNEAAQHHQVITVTKEGQRVVALPVMVRNDVVGAMEFELPNDDELPDGALELVMSVGQRLGLALENRRLFDETQRIAQREGLINDIGTELQAATSVDAIIQRTARHLQETLSAHQVTIRVGTPNGHDAS